MARYDADGYRADGRKRISGYSREAQGGVNEARARSDARREAHYTSRLPDRGIASQMGQFRNPDGSPKPVIGQVVPSYGGGTKTVMPQAKVTPREQLPATIQRPAEQSVALDAGKRMVEKMVPAATINSGLNELMNPQKRKRKTTRIMRPTE